MLKKGTGDEVLFFAFTLQDLSPYQSFIHACDCTGEGFVNDLIISVGMGMLLGDVEQNAEDSPQRMTTCRVLYFSQRTVLRVCGTGSAQQLQQVPPHRI